MVCRELGYRQALYTTIGGIFEKQSDAPIWVEEAVCTGNESSIFDCDLTYIRDTDEVYGCDHTVSAGVICESNKEPGLNGKLRVSCYSQLYGGDERGWGGGGGRRALTILLWSHWGKNSGVSSMNH